MNTKFTMQETGRVPVATGYKFCPTNDELVGCYLFNQIMRNQIPYDSLIVKNYDFVAKTSHGIFEKDLRVMIKTSTSSPMSIPLFEMRTTI